MPLEGQRISHYRLVRQLGSGSMGEVYLAEDPSINRQVAIKVIRAEVAPYRNAVTVKEAIRLFQREAKAIAILDHPHILPLYDYGEETLNGNTITYLVMPYRPEGSLAHWLNQRSTAGAPEPSLRAQDVAYFVRQAADALQHAHDRHIIHQDVKPANFLIRSNKENPNRPDLLLADFGVARFSTSTANVSHNIRGTPTYMAPEQLEGNAVAASDQYALAIMAYELLVGRPPFQGGLTQVMYQHAQVPPTPPSTFNPSLPPGVDAVLLRALAKKPEDRFPSISAFAYAFQDASQYTHAPAIPSQDMGRTINSIDSSPIYRGSSIPVPQASSYAHPSDVTEAMTSTPLTNSDTTSTVSPTGLSRANTILLIALAILIVGGGIGFFSFYLATKNQLSSVNAAATAFAQANANANATATSLAHTTKDPYTHTGLLSLNDPLQDNSQGHDWQTGANQNNAACSFTGGAYQSTQPSSGNFHACFALNTKFTNFVYEVQMTIVSGQAGGIIFRANQANSTFYYFRVGQNGSYNLWAFVDGLIDNAKPLANGSSSAIHTGTNQPNIVAVVAKGSTLQFLINQQPITSVTDGTYSSGQIGVVAYDQGSPAQVVYSNAKVWTL